MSGLEILAARKTDGSNVGKYHSQFPFSANKSDDG